MSFMNMKRWLLTLAFLLVFSISSDGQIQNRVLGLEFGEHYAFSGIGPKIGGNWEDIQINSTDEIFCYRITFGGIRWNFAYFYFYNPDKSRYSGRLYEVVFNQNYRVKESCYNAYDLLHSALSEKYGTGNTEKGETYIETYWEDGERCCWLSAELAESKGGELYWYLDLSYSDDSLSALVEAEENNEL